MVNLKNIKVLVALLISVACAGMSGVLAMDAHSDLWLYYDATSDGYVARPKDDNRADDFHAVWNGFDSYDLVNCNLVEGNQLKFEEETHRVYYEQNGTRQYFDKICKFYYTCSDPKEKYLNIPADGEARKQLGRALSDKADKIGKKCEDYIDESFFSDEWASAKYEDCYAEWKHTSNEHISDGSENSRAKVLKLKRHVDACCKFSGYTINGIRFNKAEFFAAVSSLAIFELSQFLKGNKALAARVLAEGFSLVNEISALGNEVYKDHRETFLDWSTSSSMVAHVAMLAMLCKKFLKSYKADKNFELDEKIDESTKKNNAKVNKIVTSIRFWGKYTPHIERVLALVRAGAKFGKWESNAVAQICTFIISWCRVAELAMETAESDSQIIKAAPFVMSGIILATVFGDQFTNQSIIKKMKKTA